MFISEEVYQTLIGAARAQHKPYLPTQEAMLCKALNEIPGLVCDGVECEISNNTIHIRSGMWCTQLGALNYGLIFQAFTNALDQTTNLCTVFTNTSGPINALRSHDPSLLIPKFVLTYRLQVGNQCDLHQVVFDTLHLMECKVKTIPLVKLQQLLLQNA